MNKLAVTAPSALRRVTFALLAISLTVTLPAPATSAATLPAGFTESVVFSGLTFPTAVRFSPDGRVFVAEKSGLIKVFDSLTDPTPDIFADLRTNVFNGWDRGLLGLALDPAFPTNPYVYVLYTYDHILGDPAPPPRWGTVNGTADNCPTPPGANTDGCVVSGRLSRLRAAGNAMTGSEQVLIEGWCQQFPSHSMGALQFGQDGALYVTAGDGASYDWVDYGQAGTPLNPCGDPPGGVGATLTPPTAEGGSLRSQDLRTSGDPVGLSGALLRVDPATGAALPTNPLAGNADPNARRIIAYGLRNSFRFAVRPGTNEVWLADVGWNLWEEVDRVPSATDAVVEDFGWPCYEGTGRLAAFDNANLNICENLYAQPTADTKPYYAYSHNAAVTPGEACALGSSALSGAAFELSGAQNPYPASYDNAFFFADYARGCIWVMKQGTNGLPSPGLIEPFVQGAATPVDLVRGPSGQIFYVDIAGGTIRRIDYAGGGSGPQLVTPPSVQGLAQVGATLSRVAGTWSGTQPITLTYQWQQCDPTTGCVNIAGATGTSHVVASSDLGKAIRVRETATNSGGSNFADSAQTAAVIQGSGTGYRSAVLADAPFLYWGLGEPSGLFADSSGGGNAGSATGTGMSRAAPALAGSTPDGALTFTDGTSYVSRSPVAGMPTASVTAEVWFRASAFANWSDLVSHNWGGSGGGYGWSMFVDASRTLTWGLWQSGGTQLTVTVPGLTTGSIYHAVGTYDGSALRLYLNGVQVATRTVGALALNTTAGVFTGRTDTTAGVTVDELALYRTSLSATRVQAHYVAGTTGGGNRAPTATIAAPLPTLTWRVGDTISFSGSGTDPEDGTLPASAFTWTLLQQHCPSNCHTHTVQTFDGVTNGSFPAPDHEYPSYLELQLTVRDSQGATSTTSVSIYPKTVDLTIASSPSGLALTLNSETATAPFARTVIQGSQNSVSASNQSVGATNYTFQAWSDAGAATHNVVVNATSTLTATYTAGGGGATYRSAVLADLPRLLWGLGDPSGAFVDATGNGNAGTASGTGLSRGAAGIVTSTSDGALTFTDGTSSVSRPSVSGLSASVVTVECWFRASAFANWPDLASHNWGGSGGSGWDLYLNSGRQLTWGLWQSGTTAKEVRSAALTANVIYHAVGTYDGSVLRLYLNGVLVGSATVGAVTLNTTASVFSGRTDMTSALTVDELAVYAAALSSTQVTTHYNAGR